MLPLNLKAFAAAAGWDRLPREVVECHFERTATDLAFPGAILPAMSRRGVYWYGAAATPAEWRLLQPLLLAYAGPTVTLFTGQSESLDAATPADRLLQQAGVCALARLIPGADCEKFATIALARLHRALQLRPAAKQAPREQTARLLASVDMCLAAGDRAGAERLFKLLRDELRVDTLNLHFIQVRILSSFRAWLELVEADWFAELAQARKPSVVARSMLEALWYARLDEFADDETRLLPRYRDTVQSLARPLLAQVSDASDDFVRRIQALDASRALVGLPPEAAAQNLLDRAADAPSNLHLSQARAAIEALPEEARETLLHSGAGQQAVVEIGSLDVPLPTSWPAWLNALEDPRFENAVSVAREGVTQWPVGEVETAKQSGAFAENLLRVGLADDRSSLRLVESLPSLVRWVKADPDYPRPALAAIYEVLLQLFGLVERRGSPERDAAADLFEAILRLGLSKDGYRRLLLTDFGKLIEEGAGLASVYWLIDVASALLEHPAPDTDARLILLNQILSSFQALFGSLSPGQRVAYRLIASGASWPILPAPVETAAPASLSSLEGQSIAIYTLTESSGRQAEKALQELVPSARIELAHDHVASPRLVRLARDANIFVMAAASAKHAATDCIVANRGPKPLLYAAGRGFSSIVRVVEEFALSKRERP